MICNLASAVDWQVITAGKQQQVDFDSVREHFRRVVRDYAVGNLVYMIMTGIYHKLDHNKQVLYRIK